MEHRKLTHTNITLLIKAGTYFWRVRLLEEFASCCGRKYLFIGKWAINLKLSTHSSGGAGPQRFARLDSQGLLMRYRLHLSCQTVAVIRSSDDEDSYVGYIM